MKPDTFFSIARTGVNISEGKIKLPLFYYDASAILLFFWADINKVKPLLDGSGYLPCKFFNGKALLVAGIYEYRDTDIGPYNEVGLASAVYPEGPKPPALYLPEFLFAAKQRRFGFYIHDLPVTTQIASAAGKEIYGFPKFVTEIPFSLTDKQFAAAVNDPDSDEKIFSMVGEIGPGISMKGFDLVLFSNLKEQKLKTIVDVDAKFKTSFGGSIIIRLGKSKHRTAANIKNLGLDGAKPFIIQKTTTFRSRLNAGIDI